jgi:hypothetical protein
VSPLSTSSTASTTTPREGSNNPLTAPSSTATTTTAAIANVVPSAISSLTSHVRALEGVEGVVLRMDDGSGRMYKIKSEWYVALSSLGISGR